MLDDGSKAAAPETRTVLVVDDDEDFRLQLVMQLEAAGFRVVAAEGETKAAELLQTLHPDLAVVDLMMEHLDGGFALSYKLKKMTPPVPVIMVTGVAAETGLDFSSTSETERSWIKADAMLTKPVRFEQLRREIDRLLRR
ncbi:MAG: response regulator [Candidatus Eisenbacteria bacterium]|nr:response regulator [Candidatus Eisenbacteria bacterium]